MTTQHTEPAPLTENEDPDVRFIVQFDTDPPSMTDPTGLRRTLASFVEDITYGFGNCAELRLWRWADDGRMEPLTVGCVQRCVFDAEDYAYPVWAVTSPDGATHAMVCVRIDGRA